MKPLRIVDMSPNLQLRVRRALDEQYRTSDPAPLVSSDSNSNFGKRNSDVRKRPNKTEEEYNRRFLDGNGLYEAITLRLPGGSRYTPDWMTVEHKCFEFDGIKQSVITLHEVKGSYRFHSEGRALTAFREARAAFPMFRFVWARKQKNGKWDFA